MQRGGQPGWPVPRVGMYVQVPFAFPVSGESLYLVATTTTRVTAPQTPRSTLQHPSQTWYLRFEHNGQMITLVCEVQPVFAYRAAPPHM